ncbi:transmembrane protein -like [Brachionus plicatilis]|uniref:Transmembrane protein-like n=1 Tax=Brachionus plicatilis TaxID=10195 RepID=A0A3M7RBG3_BRAPC|nr:transmembrane protein -like [Brachionus plicatilis]
MGRIKIIDNLRSYVSSDPPGVIFILCILAFILVLSSFMQFVSKNKVRNPDELDWNAFERKLADLDYCFKLPNPETDTREEIFLINNTVKSYSYPVTFSINLESNKTDLDKLVFLYGKIDGFLIGLDKENFDVNLKINEKSLNSHECNQNFFANKPCFKYTFTGCLTFSGFSKNFKKTKFPDLCEKNDVNLNEINPDKTSSFIVYKATPELNEQYWCPSTNGNKAEISYNSDESLIPFINSVLFNFKN